MEKQELQVCRKCVMDTSDKEIFFDKVGVCNHCLEYEENVVGNWPFFAAKQNALQDKIKEIKELNKNADYDCILGISGGVDSSYLALLAHKLGLRVLLVHVDAGWNNELAVSNIEKIAKFCGFDLHTKVVDWNSMRRVQVAFLRSGIANQDIPQDHIFVSETMNCARQFGVKTILSGGNFATEAVYPKSWESSELDSINIKSIINQFADEKPKDYRVLSFWKYYLVYPFFHRIKSIRLLNYIDFKKEEAVDELSQTIGWRPYPRKHGESRFTRFFQDYFLVERFGYDKRKPHLSSLINSGQLTRDEAIKELNKPLFNPLELEREKIFVSKKLQISLSQMDEFIKMPIAKAEDYPNWDIFYRLLQKLRTFLELIIRKKIQ